MKFITEKHLTILRVILGLGSSDELPGRVVEVYWAAKAASERISLPLTHHDLLHICLHAQCNPPPNPEPTFFELAKQGTVKTDTDVQVKWKNKWRAGRYRGLRGTDGIAVWIDDGSGMDRVITPDRVRLPETAS